MPYLKKYFLDTPNDRSSHISPKPKSGGLSFVMVITLTGIFSGNYQPLFSLPLAFIGLWDDLKGSSKLLRYIIQTLTVSYLIYESNFYLLFAQFFPNGFIIIPILFLILFGTAIINFINFMDGIDGIIAGTTILLFISGSILVSNSYLLFAGSLIGFLIWNWYPSKVFMGDVGSTFLGSLIVGLLFSTQNLSDTILIFIIATPILLDAFICVLRRLIHRQKVFEPHCSHLYQRLVKAGWSHGTVAILYMLFTILLLITMIIGEISNMISLLIVQLIIGSWLDQKVAIPFSFYLKTK
jgi:UDP-N-acetylmuramyl pentapeptide phosphotransferase/UDP-N-acetylglucosamine-1-phosphate transferase